MFGPLVSSLFVSARQEGYEFNSLDSHISAPTRFLVDLAESFRRARGRSDTSPRPDAEVRILGHSWNLVCCDVCGGGTRAKTLSSGCSLALIRVFVLKAAQAGLT